MLAANDSNPVEIPVSTAVQMQTQLSNLIAIQNLQEYLKYLIITTSTEPQATLTPQKLQDVKIEEPVQDSLPSTPNKRQETLTPGSNISLAKTSFTDSATK